MVSLNLPDGYISKRHDGVSLFKGKTRQELLENLQLLPSDMELFDLYRSPRVLSNPEQFLRKTTLLTESGLLEDLSCPICMGTYQTVMVVKDCLHRFCSECIQKWLRSGKQVCPKCRKRIPSRRSLRRDPIFERMVRRLFPNVRAFEAQNDDLVAKANRRRSCGTEVDDLNAQSPTERSPHDMRKYSLKQRAPPAVPPPKYPPTGAEGNQEQNTDVPVKKRRGRPPGSGSIQRAKAAALAAAMQASEQTMNEEEVWVCVRPDPHEPDLRGVAPRKAMRVRRSKTVEMIISWLRHKCSISEPADLQLTVEGDMEYLSTNETIGNLCLKRQCSGPINLVLSVARKMHQDQAVTDFSDYYSRHSAGSAGASHDMMVHPLYSVESSHPYHTDAGVVAFDMSPASQSKRRRFGENQRGMHSEIMGGNGGQRDLSFATPDTAAEHMGVSNWAEGGGFGNILMRGAPSGGHSLAMSRNLDPNLFP